MIKNMKIYNFISAWAERQEVSGASEGGIVPISNTTFTPSTLPLDKLSYVTATFIKMSFYRKITWLLGELVDWSLKGLAGLKADIILKF